MAEIKTNGTLKDLKDNLNNISAELVEAEKDIEKYNAALKKMAEQQEIITKIEEDLKMTTVGLSDAFENMNGVTKEISSGISIVQSTMKLLGAEGSDLAKILVKVQAALNIIPLLTNLVKVYQGVTKVWKAAKIASDALNVSVLKNPYIAIIVAVVAFSGALFGLIASMKEHNEQFEGLEDSYDEFTERLDKQSEAIKHHAELQRAQGKTEVEVAESTLASTKIMVASIEERNKALDGAIKKLEEEAKWYSFAKKRKIKQLKEEKAEVQKLEKKANKDLDDAQLKVLVERTKAQKDKEKKEKEHQDNLKQIRDAAAKKRKEDLEKLNKDLLASQEKYNKAEQAREQAHLDRLNELDKSLTHDKGRVSFIQAEIATNQHLQKEVRASIGDLEDQKKAIEAIPKNERSDDQIEALTNANNQLVAKYAELNDVKAKELELEKELKAQKDQVLADEETILKLKKETKDIEELELETKRKNRQEEYDAKMAELELRKLESDQKLEFLQTELDKETLTNEERIQLLDEYNAALEASHQIVMEKSIAEKALEVVELEAKKKNWLEEYDAKMAALELRKLESDQKLQLLQAELDKETLTNEERIALLEKYNEALKESNEIDKEVAESKQELEKKKQEAVEATLKTTTDVLGEATKLLGEETAAGKATAIAAATIDTFKSATSAYSSLAPIPLVGPALGVAAAAAAVAAGYSNIKSIASTKVPGESGSSTATPTTPELPSMPDVDVPIMETHNNMNAFDEEFMNQDRKVYVTEQDISQVQTRVKTVEHSTAF